MGLWLVACGLTDRAPRCVMGTEYEVATAHGMAFDDLAITTLGSRSYAFWSDDSGLFGRVLNAQGKPTGKPKRLSERCVGGIASAAWKQSLVVACLRPLRAARPLENADADLDAETEEEGRTQPQARAPAQALWLTVNTELLVTEQRELGTAGSVSGGIDVAARGDDLAVIWQDASLDSARIWLWRGGEYAEQLLLSSPVSSPAEPSLVWLDKGLFMMWSEASGDPRQHERRLVLSNAQSVQGAPMVVTTVMHEDPTPRLRELNGELYLAFRDKRGGRKPGLYVSKVSDRGALHGELSRLSRADAKAGPAIVPCFDGLLAVAPRTFGGGKFVGINWADKTLTRASQERQFYEDSRQFARAAGTCVGEHALLLIGEQGKPERPVTKLRSVGFRCH